MNLNRILKLRLDVSIFISLLILSTFSFYTFSAMKSFYTYKESVSPGLKLNVNTFHFFLKNELKKEWIKLTANNPIPDHETQLKSFHIIVPQASLDSLNANLPMSGKDHYVNASMKVSDSANKQYKIKLRYRGDNNYHWLYKQKSLRIKLDDGDVYEMEKVFNLLNPPHITYMRDYVYYKKAKELGILSPEYYPVRLFMNGEYMGVYAYLSQIDESLLRKNKLMPGSIYTGDRSGKNALGVSELWFKEKYWEKKASRNSEMKSNREDIKFFIDSVNKLDDEKFENFINKYVNKQKVFNYIALDRLYGSNHHDFSHNHKLYFDPYLGKFEFIAWDIRFWSGTKNKDPSIYPFILRVKQNAKLDYEIDKIVYKLIKNGFYESSIDLYSSVLDIQKKDILADKYKDSGTWLPEIFPNIPWFSTPYNFSDIKSQLIEDERIVNVRAQQLLNIFNDINLTYFIEANNLHLMIGGNSPIEMTINNSKYVMYPSRKWKNAGSNKYKLLLDHKNKIMNDFSYYVISLPEKLSPGVKFKNLITMSDVNGKKEKFTFHDEIKLNEKVGTLNNMVVFKGENYINETLYFSEEDEVFIEPGTTFFMGSKVSIYFFGKVVAKGVKNNLIKFINQKKGDSWGIIAVQGKKTKGSVFEYVEFENGSTDTNQLIHYTSPFNIHDTEWFEVRHCKIGKNYIGDDSMHIAYSKGIIEFNEFNNARSDALDIDISEVIVNNNIFHNSGNDGLDIMTTNMLSKGNIFINMGDKGISVGEWSKAEISDSVFINTFIGTEIKDKSEVIADNLIYINSTHKAINLYNKNNRYDLGGKLLGTNLFYVGNGNNKIFKDKKSNSNIKSLKSINLTKLKANDWYQKLLTSKYKHVIKDFKVYNEY